MSAIFLSYSSTDVATASRLRERLVAAGYASVFRDKDEVAGIPGGTEWAPELFAALGRSDIVVFLATEASLASPWCHTELAVAIAEKKFVAQISTTEIPTHPLLKARQRIPPVAEVDALADRLVAELTRAGLAPRDPFTWDPDRSPYPGLQRLDEGHAAVLFGRDAEVAACIQRLGGSSPAPLVVTGPSGSGKSSTVRAGVLPRLSLQPGTVVLPVVEPGNAPMQRVALAFAELLSAKVGSDPSAVRRLIDDENELGFAVDRLVAKGGGRVVLFLDQAEDLVDRADPDEVERLVKRLAGIDPNRFVLVAAVRSVTLDDWLRSPTLAPLATADPVWVRPLDRAALREVVTGPAHVAGIRFEPAELVERILDDTVGGNALPLLAALLEELTKSHSRRTPAVVTTEQYEAVGPVARVIERRAEQAANELVAARHVPEAAVVDAYLRLAEVDQQTRVTAAEVPVDDLPSEAREILTGLEQYRLVTRDRRVVAGHAAAMVDVGKTDAELSEGASAGRVVDVVSAVHETVFRAWPAVAEAIRSRGRDLETRTWLARDARTWAESGGGQVPLTGGRLSVATDWSERHPTELTAEVKAYLKAAVRQLNRRRILTIAVPVLSAVSLIVGILAVVAVVNADVATRSAAEANVARREADALRLVADARQTLGTRPDLSALLALEAASRSGDPQIQAAPLSGLVHGPGPRRFESVGAPIEAGRLDRRGSHSILDVAGGTLLWDVQGGRPALSIPRLGDVVAISADGSAIVRDDRGGIVVTRWTDGTELGHCTVTANPTGIRLLALSADGDRAAVVWEDDPAQTNSQVMVLDVDGCTAHPIGPISSQVDALALDDDGLLVGIAPQDVDDAVNVYGVDSGDPLQGSPAETLSVLRFGPARRLAGLTPNGQLFVWDLADPGEPAAFPLSDREAGAAVAIGGVDDAIVTVSTDGQLHRVRPGAAAPVGPALYALPPLDYERPTQPLDVASDGSSAVTIDPSGRLIVWDLDGRAALGPQFADGGPADDLAVLGDGSVLTRSIPGSRLLDRDGRTRFDHPTESEGADTVNAIGAGGDRWAFASGDQLFGSSSPISAPARIATLPNSPALALVPLPDDRWAALAVQSVAIVGRGASPVDVPISGTAKTIAVAGRWIFVGDGSGVVHTLDAGQPTAPERTTKAHEFDIASMAVSADGTTLATGSDDRTVALWTIGADGALTERSRLRGNEERVVSTSFTADGRWLATASEDSLVRLFSLDLGVELGDPIPANVGGGFVLPRIRFDPTADRRLYVAATGLFVWDLRQDGWRQMACDMIGSRRLVKVEQDLYLRGVAPIDPCP